jgi:hypothetical protein
MEPCASSITVAWLRRMGAIAELLHADVALDRPLGGFAREMRVPAAPEPAPHAPELFRIPPPDSASEGQECRERERVKEVAAEGPCEWPTHSAEKSKPRSTPPAP